MKNKTELFVAEHPPIDNRNYCRKCGTTSMLHECGYYLCHNPDCNHRFYGTFEKDPYTDCLNCGATYPINAKVCPNCGINERSET